MIKPTPGVLGRPLLPLVTAVVPRASDKTRTGSERRNPLYSTSRRGGHEKAGKNDQKTGWQTTYYFPGTFLMGCPPISRTRSRDSGTGAGESQEKSRMLSRTRAIWLFPISSASFAVPNWAEP